MFRAILSLAFALSATCFAGAPGIPADPAKRTGDEIVVCGQYFHTGAKVVLFSDPGGYDATKLNHEPVTRPTSGRGERDLVRGGDISLDELRETVDQFVLHYDAAGNSRQCFRILEKRKLSVHFMCEIDGTIYQTLDLKESAAHATIANARSVGVEIAHIGSFSGELPASVKAWYQTQGTQTRIVLPERLGDGGIRTPRFVGRPIRPQPIEGIVQGKIQKQYDYTPHQYTALAQLTATLCTVLPKIQPDFPRQRTTLGPPTTQAATQPVAGNPTTRPTALADPQEPGALIPHVLTIEQFAKFQGVLGHYHVQLNKTDPGPAFQWQLLLNRARGMMTPAARLESPKWRHRPSRAFVMPATKPASQPATGEAEDDH